MVLLGMSASERTNALSLSLSCAPTGGTEVEIGLLVRFQNADAGSWEAGWSMLRRGGGKFSGSFAGFVAPFSSPTPSPPSNAKSLSLPLSLSLSFSLLSLRELVPTVYCVRRKTQVTFVEAGGGSPK